MNWNRRRFGYECIFAIVAAASLATPAGAQQANIQSVRFYTIKPDRVGDFLAATREHSAVSKKGESNRYYSTWHSLTGANEYVRVDFYTKWADLDAATGPEPKMKEQAAQLQSITTRIAQCEESTHRVISEVLPDLGLPQTGELPKMIRVLRTRVRPDKISEYLGMVKGEVLPAAKKAGLSLYTVSQGRYGTLSSEFVSVASLNNWGDLDGGTWIQKTMGEEGYQRFLLKLRPLTVESEATIYRFVPDSSYLPAGPRK